LKPERWGSPLFQDKYQGEKVCDKRHIIIIIIIIIIMANNSNFVPKTEVQTPA